MACVRSLKAQLSSGQASAVTALIDVMADNAEELTADPEQLPVVLGEFFAPLMLHGKPQSKSAEIKRVQNTLNYMLQFVLPSETPSYIRRIILASLSKIVTKVQNLYGSKICFYFILIVDTLYAKLNIAWLDGDVITGTVLISIELRIQKLVSHDKFLILWCISMVVCRFLLYSYR